MFKLGQDKIVIFGTVVIFWAAVLACTLISGCMMEVSSVTFNSDQPYPAIGFRSRPPTTESNELQAGDETPERLGESVAESSGNSADQEGVGGPLINNQNRRNGLIGRGFRL